jgi:hypothetical protein
VRSLHALARQQHDADDGRAALEIADGHRIERFVAREQQHRAEHVLAADDRVDAAGFAAGS